MSLCYLTDPGWGDQLLEAKRSGGLLSDELVEAAAALIDRLAARIRRHASCLCPVSIRRARWSRTSRTDLPNYSTSGCPTAWSSCEQNASQKLMENSAQQLRNVDGVFGIRGKAPTGPILLVDDVVDSRWTMTVLGDLLLAAGSGPVYPFTVGKTKG